MDSGLRLSFFFFLLPICHQIIDEAATGGSGAPGMLIDVFEFGVRSIFMIKHKL